MPRWIQRFVMVGLFFALLSIFPVMAQSNLLQDPGFENNYSGRMGRGDFNFPAAWDGWWTDAPHSESWMNVAPNGYPHPGGFKRSGSYSQSISKGSGTFTAAAFQQVNDIAPGAKLRASAFVYIENNNGANSQVRIGIGSNVGTNVYGDITWSDWTKSLRSWQEITVDHTATGGSVTVFIFATQTWPNDPNAVYLDDASLIVIGQGEAPVNTGGGVVVAAPTSAPRNEVGFVSPQEQSGDGSVVHTVGSGDTLASIAVGYGVPLSTILELNNLERSAFLQIGQKLIIATPDPEAVKPSAVATETDSEVVTVTASAIAADIQSVPQSTEEILGAIPVQVSATATESPSATPAESPTPSNTPTETPIPATSTPAPTAPVVSADIQNVNPLEVDTQICIGMFEDGNQNGVKESSEAFVADGVLTIKDDEDTAIETYATDGENEPYCLAQVEAGSYIINATAPINYGLTTAPIRHINLETGTILRVNFGVKQGLQVLAIPTVDTAQPTAIPPQVNAADDSDLADYSGLIVFGIAGVVLVAGFGASLLLRRR